MKTCKIWTTEEVKLLEKHSTKGMKELRKLMPYRSEQSIRVKCCYLNLDIGTPTYAIERLYMV